MAVDPLMTFRLLDELSRQMCSLSDRQYEPNQRNCVTLPTPPPPRRGLLHDSAENPIDFNSGPDPSTLHRFLSYR